LGSGTLKTASASAETTTGAERTFGLFFAKKVMRKMPTQRFCLRASAGMAAGTLATLAIVCAVPAQQSKPPAAPTKTVPAQPAPVASGTPRSTDGHLDLTGLWRLATATQRAKICDADDCQDPNQPAYKPEYLKEVKVIAQAQKNGANPLDPRLECKPLGIPRGATGAMQIVQTPAMTAVLYEGTPGPIYRTIYTDGRKHPPDIQPSYLGHSVGHWDGDTLVVDVVGLNAETWLGGGLPGAEKYTSLHSEKEHVVERWTRKGNTMTYEATVEDPVMLQKPWIITPRQLQLSPKDDVLKELPCVLDNKAKAR
jgi:hypothetical protein